MNRREFITLLGGAATWPLAARAQQPAIPVIGFLSSLSAPVTSKRIASFGHGLSETGYAVGRDVTVETRMAMANMIDCPHWRPILWAGG
jgi:putative tryptophan/tyrosine transport system substrate-binding protein